MSALFKHLRVHQIWGANTDVGKTIMATALVRASAQRGHKVFYLKPVSTGPHDEADDNHVDRFTASLRDRVQTECLYRFGVPVSPHLAAQMALETDVDVSEKSRVPDDGTFVDTVSSYITRSASQFRQAGQVMYVEVAGGVHSPTLSGTTQVDSYRPLLLPAVLVGDSRLGGISATISAYESLILRGYTVDAVMIFREDFYGNFAYLRKYFEERNILVVAVEPPPPRISNAKADFAATEQYYSDLSAIDSESGVASVVDHLNERHILRLQELDSMPKRTLDSVWWPFVQHGHIKSTNDVTVIDSASTDFFSVYRNSKSSSSPESLLQPLFDGSASWWTQALGHAHPALSLAAASAAGRYGHVMFPRATHKPALDLAEMLLQHGPGKDWASRVFFSDNGSTGIEVALKMALRHFLKSNPDVASSANTKDLGVIGLCGSYHGDTIGAMDACEPGVYSCEWHDAKGFWFDPPTIAIRHGRLSVTLPASIPNSADVKDDLIQNNMQSAYDVEARLRSPLAIVYRKHIQERLASLSNKEGNRFAALILEPIVMGAGGMIFVDPLFQRVLVDVARGEHPPTTDWKPLPVIFDEVFVGLYRLGVQRASDLLGVFPDISVLAKILTGGTVPMAVTLATESVFKSFLSEKKTEALLHGHSYTAHAVGCAIAGKTLEIIDTLPASQPWQEAKEKWNRANTSNGPCWSLWDPGFVQELSKNALVEEVMALGTLLVVKVKDAQSGYSSASADTLLKSLADSDRADPFSHHGQSFGIHFRTLGSTAYFMTSLNTPTHTVRALEERIWTALKK